MSTDNTIDLKAIGDRLKELRDENNLVQGYVVNQAVESYIEKGLRKKIEPQILNFWANKGYSLNWIITGKGEKKIDTELAAEVRQLRKKIEDLKHLLGIKA